MRRQNLTVATASVVALSLLLFGVVLGQDSERRVKMKDLPQAVQKTVREQSHGATVKDFSKETEHGQTYYEV
jgi:Flp pilus assembly protein TadB